MKDQIVELYNEGLSCRAVGEIVGLCDETVRKHLRGIGVQRRPKTFRKPAQIPTWEAYFSDRIEVSGGCLLWTGFKDPSGYGRCQAAFAPSLTFAHRLSWFLKNGPFEASFRILHRCDTPPCVNPDHLFLGTQQDNVADMVEKGRQRAGGSPGEQHHCAVLTDDGVRNMRRIRETMGTPYHQLAEQFGVTKMTAYRACTRQSWTHI